MPEEQDLLQRAIELETKALAEIYDAYSPGMYLYAMRLLDDSQSAEDCVAESFVRFLDALQRHRGPRDHLKAYLYRIAHNWIVDMYRTQKDTLELMDHLQSNEDHPEEEASKHISRTKMRQALRNLC